ncbi:hypothetical protein Q8F55_004898 [Vanrija albida]|uniref:Major facilitator superfamily (MFS) profile domain-containing protein n=1 Tax=Vanrija albida TaxID=181172 RepID=A0ABR3Q0D4_9TREE
MSSTSIELQPRRSLEPGPSLAPTPGPSPSLHASAEFPEAGRELPSLPPADTGRDAWNFLIAATAMETTVWGFPYTIGILHNYWASEMFPGEESTLTFAATLQTGLMFMSTAVLGPLFAAFPHRSKLIQTVGLVVSSAGLIAAGFVTKADQLIPTMGVLYPFAGALYLPCATLVYEWFVERRGVATGIMFAGTGVGGTIFPFIVDALLKRFGYKATMVAVGIGFATLNAVALLFVKRRLPLPPRVPGQRRPRPQIDWGVAKTWPFWCGFFVLLLTSMGNFNPTLWIPTASVPGNALTGWISDRTPAKVTVFGSSLLAALAVLIPWGLGTTNAPLVFFSIVWGLTALSFVSLWSKLISRICKDDPTMATLIFSMFAVLRGVGNLTSGPVSTELLKSDSFKGKAAGAYGKTNFGAVLVYTAVVIFSGGVFGLFFPK